LKNDLIRETSSDRAYEDSLSDVKKFCSGWPPINSLMKMFQWEEDGQWVLTSTWQIQMKDFHRNTN